MFANLHQSSQWRSCARAIPASENWHGWRRQAHRSTWAGAGACARGGAESGLGSVIRSLQRNRGRGSYLKPAAV